MWILKFRSTNKYESRSQQPGCLRHVLSSLALKLVSWVRIPHKAWIFGMYMCLFCVCVVLCLGSALPSVKLSWNWKAEARAQGGCRTSEKNKCERSITVTARSEAWTLSASSNTGIVGSNPTQGVDVCVRLFCVCVVLCVGSGLVMGWYPVQGDLPTVYRIKKQKKRPRSKGL
jgi:hypothetical protein